MPIENIMYFALGLLVAGLMALAILPAVWKRAVRLTKRRIEAATPITLAEFRADKDQLRAEFALSARRLEMTIEQLRTRLAEQASLANQARTDVGALTAERAKHLEIVSDLEEREASLRARVLELEKEGADLAQRLRMRERDLESRAAEVQDLRNSLRRGLPAETELDGADLSGDYQIDIERLTTALAVERKRASYLEDQARTLVAELETSGRRTTEAEAAIAQMRDALSGRDAEREESAEELHAAEARIASAGTRLTELLAETTEEDDTERPADLERRTVSLDDLRDEIGALESDILADWGTDRADENALRERLTSIAAAVSRVVYTDQEAAEASSADQESLFDRVQRFADDGESADVLPRAAAQSRQGAVTDRLAALRELQGR